ncbi:MAG: endonuclease/exonuclease/phosphatase family protein [Candidatus Xenobium sp.]|jgi:endonuclease/exonuclease/phosphatase family metal-dependent hydrolase|nr:endonuclease/exonuclease/phosphatase family protein [Burkholderiales bacterium]
MPCRVWGLLALLCALACAPHRAGPPPEPGPLRLVRLATWNLHDLFDARDDPYDDEVPTPERLEADLEARARVLRELDADLLAVQEVETGELLQELARRTGYQQVVLREGNDVQRGIDVGILSRLPLQGSRTHLDDRLPRTRGAPRDSRFSRDCLEVHVAVPGGLVLLINHFKSQAFGGRRSEALRLAQAGRVREIALELDRFPLAILGDLNADPDSPSLAPLRSPPFLDPLEALPPAGRVTWRKGSRESALDYILVNQALARRVVPGSVRILDGVAVQAASDHRPVMLDLWLPDWEGQEGPPSQTGEGAPP